MRSRSACRGWQARSPGSDVTASSDQRNFVSCWNICSNLTWHSNMIWQSNPKYTHENRYHIFPNWNRKSIFRKNWFFPVKSRSTENRTFTSRNYILLTRIQLWKREDTLWLNKCRVVSTEEVLGPKGEKNHKKDLLHSIAISRYKSGSNSISYWP